MFRSLSKWLSGMKNAFLRRLEHAGRAAVAFYEGGCRHRSARDRNRGVFSATRRIADKKTGCRHVQVPIANNLQRAISHRRQLVFLLRESLKNVRPGDVTLFGNEKSVLAVVKEFFGGALPDRRGR